MNIDCTIDKIDTALSRARRPAVLWSGGKDSTVLLHLARKVMPEIEVIHFKLPFLSHKYKYHHQVQEELKLTVHDWVPAQISLVHGNDRIDVCETYSVGDSAIKVARGTEPYELGKPFVCGKEWLMRPKAVVQTDFDVLLCGHKSADEDPLLGKIPLSIDVKNVGSSTTMWYPLRDWTDEDISAYILQNNVKYNTFRYDADVREMEDKHMNADYAHACMACIDRRNAQFVYCPKLDLEVENIHERVLHEEPRFDYMGLPKVRSVLQSQGELANSQA